LTFSKLCTNDYNQDLYLKLNLVINTTLLKSTNPVDIFNLQLVEPQMNKMYLSQMYDYDLRNWCWNQKKFNIIFCLRKNCEPNLQTVYYDDVQKQEDGLFYTTYKIAQSMFAPLTLKENLLIEVDVQKTAFGSYRIDFHVKTKTKYDTFFGFHLSFGYKFNHFLQDDFELDYTISQFNTIQRQQIFNSKICNVNYSCPVLGFSISHGQGFEMDFATYRLQGREMKFNTPKTCSSCKYFCYDSLETCAVNLTDIETKIVPGFDCNDFTFDVGRYLPILA
jgi:hypothetical protein